MWSTISADVLQEFPATAFTVALASHGELYHSLELSLSSVCVRLRLVESMISMFIHAQSLHTLAQSLPSLQ